MIITRLTGGLGNQLFEYAAGKARAEKENTTLKIDLSAYTKYNGRSYRLKYFNTTVQKASLFERILYKYLLPSHYLDDHFQSEEYFKNIPRIIRSEFSLKESLSEKLQPILEEIRKSNSVSVHIRRTDYLTKQHRYVILNPNYYETAMKIISEKIENPLFFFFSDDIEWAKKNIPHSDNSVFLSNQDYEDLYLMSQCKHNITANSTFSWWGAWLNNNSNKVVITPKKWLTDDSPTSLHVGIPEIWLKI